MSDQTLLVLLGGHRIGELRQASNGRRQFVYDKEYRSRPDSTPLSLSMPLVASTHDDGPVDAFLWGILPDNPDVLRRWGRQFGASDRNPFALLSHVGEDCAGAVQFVRPDRLEAFDESEPVEWLTTEEIASKLRELRGDPTAWHMSTATGQFSLAGAQPKIALFRSGPRWGVPQGRTPTTHIIKPAITHFDDHDLNEHLCLRIARRAGLIAARSSIEAFDDERAVVIERYDRAYRDGAWIRIHQEDFCQALGLLPDAKYESDDGPSARRAVQLLRDELPRDASEPAVQKFLDALILNWLLAGTDAHAKNYSLLLSGRAVRLAPLYDVASVLPYDFHLPSTTMAMKIGGEYKLGIIERRHWERLAEEIDVPASTVLSRVVALAAALPMAIEQECSRDEVIALGSGLPSRLVAAAEAWIARCLRALGL